MTRKEMELLFSLAEKLYWQEQKKKATLCDIPYAWAEHQDGRFLVFSYHKKYSSILHKKLKEIDAEQECL